MEDSGSNGNADAASPDAKKDLKKAQSDGKKGKDGKDKDKSKKQKKGKESPELVTTEATAKSDNEQLQPSPELPMPATQPKTEEKTLLFKISIFR